MKRSWIVVPALGALALVYSACKTDEAAADTSFCGRAAASSSCADATDCDRSLAAGCGAARAALNPSLEASAAECLGTGICRGSVCLGKALLFATPTAAHQELAKDYCTFCEPGQPSCEASFYKKGSGAVGAVVLPYGEATARRVRDACARVSGCGPTFRSCAAEAITASVDEALGAELSACTRGAFGADDDERPPIGADGGPTVLTCTPKNCAGCCENDACQAGTELRACGKGGVLCKGCEAGERCNDGRCEKPCGPDTCAGCCDKDGRCQEGKANAACGAAGGACQACAGALTCSGGSCIDASCKATCSGCCTAQGCQPGGAATACGTGGAACVSCGAGRTCRTGGCVLDPASFWDVVIVSAELPPTNKSGASWDGFGGLPDPLAKVYSAEGASSHTAATTYVTDTTSPYWLATTLTNVRASELLARFSVEVWDSDTVYDDYVGGCAIPLTAQVFDGGLYQYTCPDTASSVKVKVVFRVKPR
ncbi:MAG: hypothetical protein JNL38_31680 [Myxococcales bacterium]|nr:hypothetical protein [Myxococcales bacterium]